MRPRHDLSATCGIIEYAVDTFSRNGSTRDEHRPSSCGPASRNSSSSTLPLETKSGTSLRAQQQAILRKQDKLLEVFYDQALPMELTAREQKHLDQDLAQVERRLRALEGDSLQPDEALEAAFSLATGCYSTYPTTSDVQKRQLNQVFFQKILVCSLDNKDHHAHGHPNPWTLIFQTPNVAENQAVGLEHLPDPEEGATVQRKQQPKKRREPGPKT